MACYGVTVWPRWGIGFCVAEDRGEAVSETSNADVVCTSDLETFWEDRVGMNIKDPAKFCWGSFHGIECRQRRSKKYLFT